MIEILFFLLKLFGILLLGMACVFTLFCVGAFVIAVVNLIREGGGK